MLNDLEFELRSWLHGTKPSSWSGAATPSESLCIARKKKMCQHGWASRYVYKFYALSSINLRVISVIFISRIVCISSSGNGLSRSRHYLICSCTYNIVRNTYTVDCETSRLKHKQMRQRVDEKSQLRRLQAELKTMTVKQETWDLL